MTAARRESQTRPASPGDARAYLDKAREFSPGRRGLNSGSETVWQRLGTLSMPPSARRTPSRQPEQRLSGRRTLAGIGSSGKGRRRGWTESSRAAPPAPATEEPAEYDPDLISASEAKAAVTAAARMVRIAELAVGQVERRARAPEADGKTPDLRNGRRYNATELQL